MNLYVTRHGQTIWNSENKVCGVTDIDLTAKGIEQAKELSTKLAAYKIDVIISSPLTRARRTAEILSSAIGKEIIFDPKLSEQNYGIYEGVSRDAEDFKYAKKQFPHKMSGGESLFQVAYRVYSLIEEMKGQYTNQNVLFVTHGSVCRVINTYFQDLSNDEYHKFYTGNCELKEYKLQ